MSTADEPGCGGECTCGQSGDAGFHPMGTDWEDQMRAELEASEFDADLGMAMARDSQRLIQGEISDEEFYAKYHGAVVEEFGTDERPLPEAFERLDVDESTLREALAGFDGDDVSRRDMMKKMGVGAAAVGLTALDPDQVGGGLDQHDDVEPAVASTDDGVFGGEGDGVQYGMVIDLERCDGCLQCVIGCREENQTNRGTNWMYVMAYEDALTEQQNFLVRPCQHCSNAPCVKVCPVRARHHREDGGFVLTDYETCIGCRYCQVACPYGVNYFQWGWPETPREEIPELHILDKRGREVDMRPRMGTMGKCTFCPSWQDGHQGEERVGRVACMNACDQAGMKAIHFGDLNDPESRPRQYLRRRVDQAWGRDTNLEDPEEDWETTVTQWGKLSAFRLLEEMNTEPNVIYLGNEPGPNAEQVDGPVSYEDIGSVDRRKDITDLGAAANPSERRG